MTSLLEADRVITDDKPNDTKTCHVQSLNHLQGKLNLHCHTVLQITASGTRVTSRMRSAVIRTSMSPTSYSGSDQCLLSTFSRLSVLIIMSTGYWPSLFGQDGGQNVD